MATHQHRGMSRFLVWLGLGVVVFAIYAGTAEDIYTIDAEGTVRYPVSLLREGNLSLDEYPETHSEKLKYCFYDLRGGRYCYFPIWPALHILPVAAAWEWFGGGIADPWDFQQTAAQLSMALTVVLIGLLLRREYSVETAILGVVAFGFGTVNWFVLSRVVFSNGLVQMWLALGLLCIVRRRLTPGWASAGAACFAIACFYRPSTLVLGAAVAVYVVWRLRREAWMPVTVGLGTGAAMAGAAWLMTGMPLGLYNEVDAALTSPSWIRGFYGNLFSSSRGLLLFSSWTLLALGAWWGASRERKVLHGCLMAAILLDMALIAKHWHWYGSESHGPRLTAELLPFLVLLAGHTVERLRTMTGGRYAVAAVITPAVAIATGHALVDSSSWKHAPVHIDIVRDRLFCWRDPLLLDPFITPNYEDRFETRLLAPEREAYLRRGRLSFAWEPPTEPVASFIDIIILDTGENLRLTLGPTLKTTYDVPIPRHHWEQYHWRNLVWRVRSYPVAAGRSEYLSPWRRAKILPIAKEVTQRTESEGAKERPPGGMNTLATRE